MPEAPACADTRRRGEASRRLLTGSTPARHEVCPRTRADAMNLPEVPQTKGESTACPRLGYRDRMTAFPRLGRTLLVAASLAVLSCSAAFAQPTAPAQAGTVVSKKDPLRFNAFGVNMQRGLNGLIDIGIERWSTDEERTVLLDMVAGTTDARSSQDKLVRRLRDIKPRTGYIRLPRTVSWDLKYARENLLPDGTRQIVIVTDKPVSFWAASNAARTMDYPFTLIEMRFPPGSTEGEGRILDQTTISTKAGRLELEIFGQEPTRLTKITQQKTKAQKTAEKAQKSGN
jgi:hypothetical protein